ncbi:hypothetical protein IQ13_2524 [Lacibacter cauensis]|uniref:Uncharacterized protein n=1 Tax=Lacibacter cauensis TaxID=510947 RepID=A0A562SL92_9BACT|nr:hypothetical protein [Lacibacter cauensis]TWI81506.1 hypothetical protein IQ13_2524 [Lacibacter cauensis]
MHQFNQLFYKPVLFLLLATVAIAAIWKVEIKWIALPAFVTAGLVIIYQLHKISLLFDIKYKIALEKEREKNMLNEEIKVPWSKKKESLLYYGMQIVFFICGYSITFSGKLIENYLNWKDFILEALLVGGFIGYLCYRLFRHYIHPVFYEREKEDHVKLAAFVIPILISFHAMVWINKLKPSAVIANSELIVTDKGENYRYGNKYIFLNIDYKQVRFEIPKKDFMKIREKDTVTIVIRKGALGFNYVDSFLVKPSYTKN